jgi:hypothetical protein
MVFHRGLLRMPEWNVRLLARYQCPQMAQSGPCPLSAFVHFSGFRSGAASWNAKFDVLCPAANLLISLALDSASFAVNALNRITNL